MTDHDAFDLGPVPTRLTVTTSQVRRLVAVQFPHWADLPIKPVAKGGWDNHTFHLGSDKLIRLPSAAEYAQAVDKEHRWLPRLAPRLPLPIPRPLARGSAGEDYPFNWSIYPWLDGETAAPERIADPVQFADDLAEFLAGLQQVDPTKGPQPGIHNWFRGGPLGTYDAQTQRALASLDQQLDVGLAQEIWDDALGTRWDGVDRWFHGDVAEGNLLVHDGRLTAVIDFGTCGVGDPACDLAVAWTLLTPAARDHFRTRLGVDDATWSRGRGWALWKAIAQHAAAVEDSDVEDAESSLRVLHEIFADYSDPKTG